MRLVKETIFVLVFGIYVILFTLYYFNKKEN